MEPRLHNAHEISRCSQLHNSHRDINVGRVAVNKNEYCNLNHYDIPKFRIPKPFSNFGFILMQLITWTLALITLSLSFLIWISWQWELKLSLCTTCSILFVIIRVLKDRLARNCHHVYLGNKIGPLANIGGKYSMDTSNFGGDGQMVGYVAKWCVLQCNLYGMLFRWDLLIQLHARIRHCLWVWECIVWRVSIEVRHIKFQVNYDYYFLFLVCCA